MSGENGSREGQTEDPPMRIKTQHDTALHDTAKRYTLTHDAGMDAQVQSMAMSRQAAGHFTLAYIVSV